MKKTILLIEDDPPTIEIYKTVLERADSFKVEAITLGPDALERIKEIKGGKVRKPDLILLNLKMGGGVDGQDILKEIRKNEETKDIIVFIMSNHPWRILGELGYDVKLLEKEVYLLKTDYTPGQLVKLIKERLKVI